MRPGGASCQDSGWKTPTVTILYEFHNSIVKRYMLPSWYRLCCKESAHAARGSPPDAWQRECPGLPRALPRFRSMNSITQPDQPNWPGPTQSMPFEHPSFFARYLCFWGIAFNEAIPSRYFLSFTHARNSDTSCYFSSTANITESEPGLFLRFVRLFRHQGLERLARHQRAEHLDQR